MYVKILNFFKAGSDQPLIVDENQINRIYGPIGIKLGGRSAPEIALSIISQLVSEVYKK